MRLAAALLAMALVGTGIACTSPAVADDRCVIRLDRGDVDITRGELRIDLARYVRRQCRDTDISRLRLERVTIALEEERRDRGGYGGRDDADDRGPRPRRPRGDEVEIYRFFSGRQHMVSDDPGEGSRRGYGTNEGVLFSLFRNNGRNRAAVYSCYVPSQNDHFLSLRSDCEGQRVERRLGYVAESRNDAAPRALYRCYNSRARNHIMTTNDGECRAVGYAVEPILGYVP